MRSFSSLALAAARSKAAVVVVLRLRRMRRSVTAQDLANVCESLDGGERVHFLPADSTGEAAATSSGLTRMIANGLPSGANAAMVGGDGKVDQVAAKPSKARQRSDLIPTRKPRIAGNVGHQDRGQLPRLAHSSGSPALRTPSNTAGRFGVCSFIHLIVIAGLRRRASASAAFASSILPACAKAADRFE